VERFALAGVWPRRYYFVLFTGPHRGGADDYRTMAKDYSLQVVNELTDAIAQADLERPERLQRYEPGRELSYDIAGVAPAPNGRMPVRVARFVGGGFAGQVYRVELLELDAPDGPIGHLKVGERYAMKILIPPSSSAERFRNLLYAVGFQSPFSLQCNRTAARSGALWQTLIRRAAKMRFGTEEAVTEIHATFVDSALGSCGEISEWIDGRVWRFEVDDHLARRRSWKRGDPIDDQASREYLAKKQFMGDVVDLLHEMGAPELARQYEWWTCKSQPNCLKRLDAGDDPAAGLTAVDFRAGLALLPLLPMSPRDVVLIGQGLCRGSLVQFDRGNLKKLGTFIADHRDNFADLTEAVEELKVTEKLYHDGQIDLTHNLPKLLTRPKQWGTVFDAAVESWGVRNITDQRTTESLRRSRFGTFVFGLFKFLPGASAIAGLLVLLMCLFRWQITSTEGLVGAGLLLVAPPVGRFLVGLIGRADLRRHYGSVLTCPFYLLRAFRAHIYERTIEWHRDGRVDERYARGLLRHPWLFLFHLPFSLLPVPFLHRLLTDPLYILGVFQYIAIRPLRLLFNAQLRENWLRQMLEEGRRKHMITDDEATEIEAHIADPFIQKYIKSLAVHVCTLPISQVVALIAAVIYSVNRGLNFGESMAMVGVFIAAVQVVPISPGSLVRGLYVLYLVIRNRDFKSYNIAVFLGFFKYVGYLAFPIQMAYRYPTLSRFMAGHWATGAVKIIPVFGEHGALAEHAVFDLFFNYSMTLRRRIRARAERRGNQGSRYWAALPAAIIAAAVYSAIAWLYVDQGRAPTQKTLWYATILVPLFGGWLTARWAGGMATGRRIVLATIGGLLAGAMQAGAHTYFLHLVQSDPAQAVNTAELLGAFGRGAAWRMFSFAIFATLGAIIAETFAPEPRLSPAA